MSGNGIRRGMGRSRLPAILTVLGAIVVGVSWYAFDRAERSRLTDATRLTAEQVQRRLVAWTGDRTAALQFFADHAAVTGLDRDEYQVTAARLLELYPGFQAVNLVDPLGRIVLVVPEAGNEPALNRRLDDHPAPSVRAAFTRARQSGALETSEPIPLFQGGRGVPTYRAIRDAGGRTVGYVNGVFRVDSLVDNCLSEASLRQDFRFRLRGPGGDVVYEHLAGDPPDEPWPDPALTDLPVFDQRWSLELAPSDSLLQRRAAWTDALLGIVGLALVGVMGLLLRAHFRRLEDLSESRARYQLLVENAADLIVKVDREGRSLYVSPSYCGLFGMTEDELLGRPFLPLVHEDDRDRTERSFRKVLDPPYSAYIEHRALTRRGVRWVSWSNTGVLDEQGQLLAVIGVGRDVTERRELEDQLRHSQKMQAVGQLAGGVAHDFNNILQSMLGNLAFAREALPGDHPALADLANVERGAHRAARLTRQLLAFSRQEVLRRRPIDPNRVVEQLLRMVRPAMGETVSVEFLPGASVGPVDADPAALEQVVMNLCLNARDAIGGSGRIRVRTDERVVPGGLEDAPADLAPGRWVLLEVSDDGVGMDKAVLARIFEPFFTTKERGRGTGLGLSTVYGIVSQHGGLIDARSAPGAGSTFRVFLPRVDGPISSELPSARDIVDDRGHGEVILVAEDDDSVRDLACRGLQRAGYRVVSAATGTEAISVVEAQGAQLSLVLLDVVMPGMGGYDAAQRIRELRPCLPILFTSGHDPDAPAVKDQAAEHDRFLPKPYSMEALRAHVRAALTRAAGGSQGS